MSDTKLFFYNGRLTLTLDHIKQTNLGIFKNGYEAVFSSNPFTEYKECVSNCANMMSEILKQIHDTTGENYILIWESNPALDESDSKTGNLKEWDPTEILRFYVLNKDDIHSNRTVLTPMMSSIYEADKKQFSIKSFSPIKH